MSRSISLRACWGSIIISVENPWWFWHGIFIVFDMEFMIKMLIQNRSHLSNKEESLYVKASSSYDACRCHAPVRSNQSKISRKSVEKQSNINRKSVEKQSKIGRKAIENRVGIRTIWNPLLTPSWLVSWQSAAVSSANWYKSHRL